MSVPIPALLELDTPVGSPWVYTFNLQNEDGSGIDGSLMEAHVHFWNEARTIQYGVCSIDWITRNPAVIEATASSGLVGSIGAGNTGFGDLLLINGGRRQYMVRLRLEVTP